MHIVKATTQDIDDLTQVEIASKTRSIGHLIDPVEIEPNPRHQRWVTYFQGKTPSSSKLPRVVLKAMNDAGELVGYIAGHQTERFGLDVEIQSFYVLKDQQRQGVGTALLESFKLWVKEQAYSSVCVGIHPENPYRAFYLKYGAVVRNPHWLQWDQINQKG